MKRLMIAAAAALSLAAPIAAPAADNILDKLVNDPGSPEVTGAKAALRDDPKVQGGKSLRIAIARKGANPWDVSVDSAINKPVKAGDKLLLAFWARVEKGENGGATAVLPYNAVQLAQAPYTALFNQGVTIGPQWKIYEVQGKADKDYPAGALKATVHLATARQTVDIGPMFVLDLGQ